ncbi:MAG: hypothetical protein U0Q16_15275 [Bryobacteraceae bacterium]
MNPRPILLVTFALIAISIPRATAQPPVSPENLHERVIAVVPMIGTGKPDDPRRPLFAPTASAPSPGILGFSCQPADDANIAICEFIARDRKSLDPLLKANRADVKTFIRGVHAKQDIDLQLKAFKRNFDIDAFLDSRHKAAATIPAPAPKGSVQ